MELIRSLREARSICFADLHGPTWPPDWEWMRNVVELVLVAHINQIGGTSMGLNLLVQIGPDSTRSIASHGELVSYKVVLM